MIWENVTLHHSFSWSMRLSGRRFSWSQSITALPTTSDGLKKPSGFFLKRVVMFLRCLTLLSHASALSMHDEVRTIEERRKMDEERMNNGLAFGSPRLKHAVSFCGALWVNSLRAVSQAFWVLSGDRIKLHNNTERFRASGACIAVKAAAATWLRLVALWT